MAEILKDISPKNKKALIAVLKDILSRAGCADYSGESVLVYKESLTTLIRMLEEG